MIDVGDYLWSRVFMEGAGAPDTESHDLVAYNT